MSDQQIRIAELFAGVGGFRLGLEGYPGSSEVPTSLPPAGPFKTVWANQWEPPGSAAKQFAWRCYEARFGLGSCVNEDINAVLNGVESGITEIPDVDMVVGGFPCQDYSVAKPLSHSGGIEGKKGVLWWDIFRFLELKSPTYVLLENVDRLLKSPSKQRGRDFAIMLSCLAVLGYAVEWRVVNSADYGFPQRRKRVYIFAVKTSQRWDLAARATDGVLGKALPISEPSSLREIVIPTDPYVATNSFGAGAKRSVFDTGGIMQDFYALTFSAEASHDGERQVLGDVLISEDQVPEDFFLGADTLPRWQYLKGAKREERIHSASGFSYIYSEGAMAFPDSIDKPSRTILTGEGGKSASRFKHVVQVGDRYRRLVPDELDVLQGFPPGWTDAGITDGQRAFCMGNALVVGIPHLIGKELARRRAAGLPS